MHIWLGGLKETEMDSDAKFDALFLQVGTHIIGSLTN